MDLIIGDSLQALGKVLYRYGVLPLLAPSVEDRMKPGSASPRRSPVTVPRSPRSNLMVRTLTRHAFSVIRRVQSSEGESPRVVDDSQSIADGNQPVT